MRLPKRLDPTVLAMLFLGGALLPVAMTLALLSGPRPVSLVIGSGQEAWQLADGLYAPERNPSGPYRWTGPWSLITLADVFPGAAELQIRAAGLPAEGAGQRRLTVWANGQSLGSQPVPADWRTLTYTFRPDPQDGVLLAGRQLDLVLSTEPGHAPGDPRDLGVALSSLTLVPVADPRWIGWLSLGLAGGWLCLLAAVRGVGATAATTARTAAALGLLTVVLAAFSPWTLALAAGWLGRNLPLAALLAILLWAVSTPLLAGKEGPAPTLPGRLGPGLAVFIVVAAAALRFARLRDLALFMGDQGTDLMHARGILMGTESPLLGPHSGAAFFHVGPGYFYLLGLVAWPLGFDPIAGSLLAAAATTLACALLYILGKAMFGQLAGLIAAAAFAVSPLSVEMAKSAWNPSPLPLLAAVGLYSLFRVASGDGRWYLGLVAAAALAANHHASAVLLAAPLALTLVFYRRKIRRRTLTASAGILALGLAPLALYQVLNGWPDAAVVTRYLSAGPETALLDPLPPWVRATIGMGDLWGRLLVPSIPALGGLLGLGLARAGALGARRQGSAASGAIALVLWLSMLALMIVFRGRLYDHYFMLFVPVPFLLVGLSLQTLARRRPLVPLALAAGGLLLAAELNASLAYLGSSPPDSLAHLQEAAAFIAADASGQPVDVEMRANGEDTGDGARYVLQWSGVRVQDGAARRYLIVRPDWHGYEGVTATAQFGGFKVVRE